MLIECDTLARSAAPVESVEGISLSQFDKEYASNRSVFPFALWQYDWIPLSTAHDLLSFSEVPLPPSTTVPIRLHRAGKVHALVVWIDYYLDSDKEICVSSAPCREPSSGKQGVCFAGMPHFQELKKNDPVMATVLFDRRDGELSFTLVCWIADSEKGDSVAFMYFKANG